MDVEILGITLEACVGISCLNPNFSKMTSGGEYTCCFSPCVVEAGGLLVTV